MANNAKKKKNGINAANKNASSVIMLQLKCINTSAEKTNSCLLHALLMQKC